MTRLWYRSAVEDADDRFLILSFSNDGDESFWEWLKDGTTRLIASGSSYDYCALASVNVPPQPKGYSFWW